MPAEVQPNELVLKSAREILKGFQLPPQPTLISSALKAMPNLELVAECLNRDPALSASILKIVNSSAYQRDEKITSVLEATAVLEIDGIKAILNAASIKKAITSKEAAEN